ncbi:hypothetical protein GCM10025771_25350 [Niveibacterium umoris]|uniref:Uncharacterized protein n=1 Tax=Niveibacterium umoris TaxID=1193620 RepID=A0A840BN53_9RHOO|nr:hypothetical protein [Niveibacterium umoris]MBB4012276.1 hypothetical protein [Niveibacterium umoris]
MSRFNRALPASLFRAPLRACETALSLRSLAMLDVVRRRGRTWGLLATYEEGRLGLH